MALLLVGVPAFAVNSVHGQAVNRLADGLRVEACAPDGLVDLPVNPFGGARPVVGDPDAAARRLRAPARGDGAGARHARAGRIPAADAHRGAPDGQQDGV